MITPYWQDLNINYNRFLDPTEDVFLLYPECPQEPFIIKFKMSELDNAPQINTAVGLYPDGTIRFYYGQIQSTWEPIVGISDGTGTYILSTYNEDTNLSYTDTLKFTPNVDFTVYTETVEGGP